MCRYDIDGLKAAVTCSTLLNADGWKVDLRDSTEKAIKYRKGEGEIIIVIHCGKGWFDPMSEAKGDVFSLAQHLGSRNFAAAIKTVADLVNAEPAVPVQRRGSRPTEPVDVKKRWVGRPLVTPRSLAWDGSVAKIPMMLKLNSGSF